MGDRPEIQQGNIANDQAKIEIDKVEQTMGDRVEQNHSGSGDNVAGDMVLGDKHVHLPQQSPDRTGSEPPNNLGSRGVDRDRFFGRDDVLQDLHDRLGRSDRVAVTSVAGMGGMGKSELAVQYARWRLQEGDYRGGVVWLAGERSGIELLGFAKAQFFPDVDLAQLGDLREQLTFIWSRWPVPEVPPESVLLVFDDVTDYRSQVADLLPSDKRFRAIVTTREQIQGIDRLDLAVLKPLAAMKLLVSIVGRDRVAREARTARDLLKWLGFLPLGLELVGYYLQRKPNLSLAKMLERLNEKRLATRALVDVPVTLTAQRGVAAAFELSWEAIGAQEWGESAQALAMRLSLFAAAPIPWGLMQDCWAAADEEELEDWRDGLVALHLVEDATGERYQLHPLIREFFAAKLAARAEATAWRTAFAVTLTKIAKTIEETVTLEQQAQVREAMPHLEAATDYCDLLSDDDCGWPFNGLARFYEAQSLFEDAERCSQHCLAVSETRFGADHPDTATSLNNLAYLYNSQGKYDRAEPLYQRALDICEQQLGADHPDTAASLNNLAGLYHMQGKYDRAEPLYQRALEICEQQLGADHPYTATSLNNLAGSYKSQGKYDLVEPLYQRALEIRERQLGADHPDTAASLNSLAALYHSQGKYDRAEPLYQRALAIRERQLGADHPDTAQSLNNLAYLYNSQGKYDRAEPLFRRALEIRERQLGADHPDTAQSLNNLALLYHSQGKYDRAEPLYQRALAIWERQLGADHPDTAQSLNNLAALYDSQGKYDRAEPLYQRALDISERQLGADHPATATSLNNLAVLYCYQDRWGEAERLLVRALLIRAQVLGEAHPDTQGSIRSLFSLIDDALEQGRAAELSDHPLTQSILQQLTTPPA
jgi:tetratricopeptide (TPR) repeat protein